MINSSYCQRELTIDVPGAPESLVVRAFPGGQDGFPVTATAHKHTATFKLADLRRALQDELSSRGFTEDRRPLALDHLRVVALVQDNKTRHILQAAQVEVKER